MSIMRGEEACPWRQTRAVRGERPPGDGEECRGEWEVSIDRGPAKDKG